MFGFGLNLGRSSAGTGGASLPAPTTVNFTSAQFSPGIAGSTSTTRNAARIYLRGDRSVWAGFISGTDATIKITSDFNALDGMVGVSIDGGAFSDCPHIGDMYTLFTGLPHGSKFVQIRFNFDWADVTYLAATGDVLFVTGQPPQMTSVDGWLQNGVNSATGFYNGAQTANLGTFTPQMQAVKGSTYGSSIGSFTLKGAFTELYAMVMGQPARVGVCKNGGAPTFHSVTSEGTARAKVIRIPCDGSLATYSVWDSGGGLSDGNHFAVAGNAPLQAITTGKRMDQYGDSITYGSGPGADAADTETMQVAAALGFTGSTHGIGGHTIAQCKTLLDTTLPLKTVTSADVAILAIGRNNTSGGIDSTEQADYLSCINKLLTKGYGKVLCRAILPDPNGAELWTAQNAALQTVVTTLADPKVIWVPTSTWLGYGSSDGLHPTAAGYVTLKGFAIPAYSSALGI